MCVVKSIFFLAILLLKMVSYADDGCHAFRSLISILYILFLLGFGTHSYPSLFHFTYCTA